MTTSPARSSELAGRTALVTGAGSGIGRASAVALAAAGAAVAAVDRDADAAAATCAMLIGAGAEAIGVNADCGDERDIDRAVTAAVDRFGGLDVVHANAAVQWFGDVLECTPEQWDAMFAVNLRGVWLLARRSVPELRRKGGAFIATGSDCAIRTSPQAAAYTAAKAGLIGLIRSIAVDFGADGVRANLVTPGVTDTPGLRRLYSQDGRTPEEGIGRAAGLSPLGRVGRPDDLADAVVFLASDSARFVTGANLMVDGGMTVTYAAD